MRAALVLIPASVLACAASEPGATDTTAGDTTASDTTAISPTTGEPATTGGTTTGASDPTGDPPDGMIPIPADPQRDGDPDAGYHALLNNNYVSCGIPWTAYSQVFGEATPDLRLPGRDGKNATLPYYQTAFTTPGGVELVTANCLQCHAGFINGELVVGLGETTADFTVSVGGTAALAAALLSDPDEQAELQRFVDRLAAVEPYTRTQVIGVNPADNVAAVLFAHRDPKTFEWNDPPLLELPEVNPFPVDVPPWWWMKKKHAMFYVAGGRGDHARTMIAPLAVIGTDPMLATGAAQFSDRFLDWFNNSFFGEVAWLAPEAGYMAPPLDGVWASAPYLHNGSVPTVAAVLDSGARPQYWTRSFDSTDYDQAALGWNITDPGHGHADEPDDDKRKRIYDTTLPGHTNTGHPFGDALSADDRRAVIEYLKTL